MVEPVFAPRKWQTEALGRWLETRTGVVSVVTGAGKTGLALLAFAHLIREDPSVRLVVVVPTIALLDQWAVNLAVDLGLEEKDLALFSGESSPGAVRRANIVVINTARSLAPTLAAEPNTLFVVDECHRAGSKENARALRVGARYRLGLSATPQREFDDGFERWIRPALGSIIYEYSYADAKRDGLIPEIDLQHYRVGLSEAEIRKSASLSAQLQQLAVSGTDPQNAAFEHVKAKQRSLGRDSPRRVIAAVALARNLDTGARIIFHERIRRADEITRLLDRYGQRVVAYHSQIGPVIRRRNLRLFKVGQVKTLVTCRALDEGLDVPDAHAAIIAASTQSTRQRIQRLGRVLRPAPGKTTATVCTIYGTDWEREALVAEASGLEGIASVTWHEVRL